MASSEICEGEIIDTGGFESFGSVGSVQGIEKPREASKGSESSEVNGANGDNQGSEVNGATIQAIDAIQAIQDALFVNLAQTRRLVTHEDGKFAHAHKIIGSVILGHFVYRLWLWFSTGDLGFANDPHVLTWISIHALLHVSSFQFILPSRRNMVYNIIWPEMRWHSLIFAYRALAVMLCIWFYEQEMISHMACVTLRCGIILATMLIADRVTHIFKSETKTMRNNPYPAYISSTFIKYHNLFYSASQIFATLNMMYRGYDMVFLTLIPIQTAPFCMTLVKKGIINQMGWHLYYTIAVLFSYLYAGLHIYTDTNYTHIAAPIMLMRFGLGVNKYVLWLAAIAQYVLAI